jgi:hypothetical protein
MGLSRNRREIDEKRLENRARSQIISRRPSLRSRRDSTEARNWLKTRAFRASGRRDSSVQNYLSTYLALRIAKERRIADFVRTAEFHEKQAARLRRSHHELGWIKTPPLTDKEIEILYYHNWLSMKYRTAASRPWLPVKPDPPEPR